MTIKEIIIKYCRELENIIDTPRLDVELLLKRALGDVDSMYIRMYLDKELSEDQEKYFLEMMKDRLNQRPIAYILGNREFMGLDFFVKEGVLIPRPDTETLVEEIINICNNKTGLNILDIGTGSGAITVSLAKYLDKSHIVSVDISDIALEIASKNAVSNKVDERIDFIKSDVFSNVSRENKFDIIVSNPPYIKRNVIDTLDEEVKKEPYIALDGGEDGLYFYKKIIKESYQYLKYGGYLCLEIGFDQKIDVIELIENEEKFENTYSKKDLYDNDRVIVTRIK